MANALKYYKAKQVLPFNNVLNHVIPSVERTSKLGHMEILKLSQSSTNIYLILKNECLQSFPKTEKASTGPLNLFPS